MMKVFAFHQARSFPFVVDHFIWQSFWRSRVVHVGGSGGHAAMALARKYPEMEVIVQNPGVVSDEADAKVPKELNGRVRFMCHDLFKQQPVKADVYFLRRILHNHTDKACVRILRALIPALRPGSRILVNEIVLEEKSEEVSLWEETVLRSTDQSTGAVANGRERSIDEWLALVAEADPRFQLQKILQPIGSALAFVIVDWVQTGPFVDKEASS
ncbi:S-adenosyl-L-methionine-dependent methyltransferase [Astrocystis sublimbata]|nr:S-adenosyl-L-methionine-dependent methyltransferase [Astrocystis sublimbata]